MHRLVPVLSIGLLATSACALRTLDVEDGEFDDDGKFDDDGREPDDDGPDDDGRIPGVGCPTDGELFGDFISVKGSTAGNDDSFWGACGGEGTPDASYLWEVPYDGQWVIDTQGSSFDTMLSVRVGGCFGEEVSCNDDGFDLTSRIEAYFNGGEQVAIAIDGFSEVGDYQLNIAPLGIEPPPPPDCLEIELGEQTDFLASFPVLGEPIAAPNSCSDSGEGPDVIFAFTAAEAGTYRISAGGEFGENAVLDLRTPFCGPSLDCTLSEWEFDIEAGETTRVGVEVIEPIAGSGWFEIEYLEIDPPPPMGCPMYKLPGTLPSATTELAGEGVDVGIGGCSPVPPNSVSTFSWRASGYGDVIVRANTEAEITSLFVQEASCMGAELVCVTPQGFNPAAASTTLTVEKGREYIITVGSLAESSTDVSVSVEQPNP